MRLRLFFLFSVLFFLSIPSAAQTPTLPPPERDAQAVSLLRGALAAMTAAASVTGGQSTAVTDVTLNGTVRRVAGSLDESGTATLKGTAAGASLTEFDLPSGTLEESRDLTAATPAGTWEESSGAPHPVAFHNLATDPTWFYPALLIERALSTASYGILYAGAATRNGVAANDIRIYSYLLISPTSVAGLNQTLGQMDLYLDATTSLPLALDFDTHLDKNALVNLPVEVRYLSYAKQGVAMVPSEIRKYIDDSLSLDIQVSSAQLDTGLTSASLSLQ